MKKILSVILAASLLPVILTACSTVAAEEEPMVIYNKDGLSEDEIVLDNGKLELHFDPVTTQFYVLNKKDGTKWLSNPVLEAGDTSTPVAKRRMQSQITLTHTSRTDVISFIDNYQYSIQKGIFQYEVVNNGIEVSYTIGDIERIYYMPYAVPEARMMEFYNLMTKSEQRKIDEYYKKYDINKLLPNDDKAALLEKFPDLETTLVYEIRSTISAYLRVQIEELFESYGYTVDDYYNDMEIYNISSNDDKPSFNVTIRYELVDNQLVVSVPMERIEYNEDYPIIELNVLPYFASGGLEDEGFMLVPDGSGAVINFNNGKFNQNVYSNNVYGWDEGLYRDAIISDNRANFPVFGVELNGRSVLCVIDKGASYATVKADVSGREGTSNYVYAQYSMIHGEKADISSKSDQTVMLFEKSLPKETIVQNYIFCEKTGYVGMANEYRNFLMNKYPELQKQTNAQVPVAVELIGAVTKTQYRAGLPFDLPLELTSYKEMQEIVEDLNKRGFDDVNYRLTGWFNDGYTHKVPTNVNLISELGGSSAFKNLVKAAETNNAKLYLEADFLNMRHDGMFDGFSPNNDASRFINRELVEVYPFSFVWYGERDGWGILAHLARPEFMLQTIDNYVKKINNSFNVNGVAFRTIGTDLAGDYNEFRFVSREESMNMQTAKLKELSDSGTDIIVNNGYEYTVPYADFIIDMPLSYQGFSILDYEVPFYQIALHGLVSYSSMPMNLAEDHTLNELRTIETGAGLSFSFIKENTSVLQETKYHQFYSNEYDKWVEDATELYNRFTNEFSEIYTQYIVNHTILDKDVVVTEYENGTKVVVNKSSNDYNYNGTVVKARDYLLIKGGA